MKPKVILENWSLIGESLTGNAYGHPDFEEGEKVRTSTLTETPKKLKKGDVVETKNTMYTLGEEYSND